ncbi:MAG: phosphotransferase [Candidatus Margulisbacteria bacterium]|nr:phosphotransferase [Candidatus Margulisiibacteriota bacterium]MBU1616899.1 phosphotransferase [Candidatus Margulisiibacteriota bacterium]MBU1867305.1 phosphotransferase [Candidatus Margulisiibacteriota bacterium]
MTYLQSYIGFNAPSLSVTARRNAGLPIWRNPDNYRIIGDANNRRLVVLDVEGRIKHGNAPVYRGFLISPETPFGHPCQPEPIFIKFPHGSEIGLYEWLEKEKETLTALIDIPRVPRFLAAGQADIIEYQRFGQDWHDWLKNGNQPPYPYKMPFIVISSVNGTAMNAFSDQTLKFVPSRQRLGWLTGTVLAGASELLARVHDHGIIHRDLKPAHILYDQEEQIVGLIDFGSSTRIADRPINGHFGTLAFFPPEYVFEPPEKEDPRIDAYSIGSTAFTLASGGGHIHYGERLPVDTVYNFVENIWAYRSAGVAELIKESNLPAELKETSFARYIFQLMHPDINQRPINMREIADNFRRIGAELG